MIQIKLDAGQRVIVLEDGREFALHPDWVNRSGGIYLHVTMKDYESNRAHILYDSSTGVWYVAGDHGNDPAQSIVSEFQAVMLLRAGPREAMAWRLNRGRGGA